MDNNNRDSFIFIIFMVSFIYSSHAYQFNVGGRDGWVVNPSEGYNHWSGRMRFQVNDTLFFKYEKGSNSVLVVNKDDYSQCNVDKPITKFEDGNTIFKFDRSGPFYFISGNKTNCDKGQKIITVVLAIRTPPKPPAPAGQPPALTPAPVPAPAGQPPALTPAPGSEPPAPVPAPSGHSPALTPAPTPTPTPTPFISPISPSPVATPPSNAPTPASSPNISPSPSSSVNTPPSPPSPPPPPGSPSSSTPGSITPPSSTGTSTPINSPPNASARPPAFTPSTVLMSTLSLVFSVTLGASIVSL